MMRTIGALAALLLAVTLGGCMSEPDSKESATSLRESRATIIEAVKATSRTLTAGGTTVADAKGGYSSCGSAPTDAIEYRGGGRVDGPATPLAERIQSAVRALEAEGWKVTDSSFEDKPRPYARLGWKGLKLSLDGDVRQGSEAMVFTVTGSCIRAARGQMTDFVGTDKIDVEE